MNKHLEDFVPLSTKIFKTYVKNATYLVDYTPEKARQMVNSIARTLLDAYNQGYDDSILEQHMSQL